MNFTSFTFKIPLLKNRNSADNRTVNSTGVVSPDNNVYQSFNQVCVLVGF